MNADAFFAEILENPADPQVWGTLGVVADWLEERGDPRGELLRLTWALLRPGGEQRRQQEERVRALLAQGVRPCWPTLTNSLGIKLALIPPGTFLMGSPPGEEERIDNEGPQHEVTIGRPFYLGVCAVTQEQYERVMGTNPSWFSPGYRWAEEPDPGALPVENLSWDDAMAFCRKLSALPEEVRCRRVYRLPTEAEWEYACRGGASSSTPFHFGHDLSSTQANFNGSYPYGGASEGPFLERTTAAGAYPANAFGVFDMHGNVRDWVADWYGEYPAEKQTDPDGSLHGSERVARGGGWFDSAADCRASYRVSYAPSHRSFDLGFRLAANHPEAS
jgi:uncharacterized protein (TIGR02996 family)